MCVLCCKERVRGALSVGTEARREEKADGGVGGVCRNDGKEGEWEGKVWEAGEEFVHADSARCGGETGSLRVGREDCARLR